MAVGSSADLDIDVDAHRLVRLPGVVGFVPEECAIVAYLTLLAEIQGVFASRVGRYAHLRRWYLTAALPGNIVSRSI